MKNTFITSALVAVLGLALASVPVTLQAQSTNAPASTTSSKTKSDYVQYSGTITAMDAKSMTISTSKGSLTLMVDENTKYMVNKKKSAATDFAVGDKVTGSYMKMGDGTMMAHSVHKKQSSKNP
jgi:frataxin-like iron-binding protein CyaY